MLFSVVVQIGLFPRARVFQMYSDKVMCWLFLISEVAEIHKLVIGHSLLWGGGGGTLDAWCRHILAMIYLLFLESQHPLVVIEH